MNTFLGDSLTNCTFLLFSRTNEAEEKEIIKKRKRKETKKKGESRNVTK